MPDDLQTAHAIGELSANLSALGRSIDLLRSEGAARDSGLQTQITEVATQQRVALTNSATMSERLENHLKSDEVAQESAKKSNEANHQTVLTLIGKVQTDLGDLLTWRGKILGGLAVIGILIGIFGHYIADLIGGFWHSAVK